ncbi:MAG: Lpg1974 family pore-forming outer membrane protein [Chlamydiae bacterium]|nr:Lpg1974 family pore-forming outer membrane protein [Chlamydiota bacterium]
MGHFFSFTKKSLYSIIYPLFLFSSEIDVDSSDIVFTNYLDGVSEIAWNENSLIVDNIDAIKESPSLFANTELLFWKAEQSGLGVVIKHQQESVRERAEAKNLKLNGIFGSKLGFAYILAKDEWDVEGRYSRCQTKIHEELIEVVSPVESPSLEDSKEASLHPTSSSWSMELQMSDLEIGRDLALSSQVCLRPHLGMRGAWILQKYHSTSAAEVDRNNHFIGMGARVGCDSIWQIYKGLSLFGDGAFSVLSGVFDRHEKRLETITAIDSIDNSASLNRIVTLVDLSCGLKYDLLFASERYSFGMKMGYEYNYILNRSQFIQVIGGAMDSPNRYQRPLSLMGLTCRVHLNF